MPFDGAEFRADPPQATRTAAMGQRTQGAGIKTPALAPRLGRWLGQRVGLWLRAPASPGIALPPELAAARLLRAARALIAEEDRWVQGRYETLRGRRCAMGALQAAARALHDTRGFETARDLLRTEALIRGYSHVEKMNDRSTHTQVLAAFDSAIARAGYGGRL